MIVGLESSDARIAHGDTEIGEFGNGDSKTNLQISVFTLPLNENI
jgi:hypothetical protein